MEYILAAIVAAVGNGEVSTAEASQLSRIVGDFSNAVMAETHEARIAAIEENLAKGNHHGG